MKDYVINFDLPSLLGKGTKTVKKTVDAIRAEIERFNKLCRVITEIGDKRVRSAGDVIAAIDKYNAGDTITLKLYRYNYDADGNLTSGYIEVEAKLELKILD
jgi:hypothetical protein